MPLSQESSSSSNASLKSDEQYLQTIAYYNMPRWQKVSLGLDRISMLLELLGNPQDNFKAIHVAGTNGKGTTCAYLDTILRASGYKCGLFTSPYINRFEERIRVNGIDITEPDLISITIAIKDAAQIVEQKLGEHPTEFELMCAAAFVYFSNQECDVVVCEVGLGGRLDATNVVSPILSVITRIGLDHTDILGETIEEIAFEKAGIIKSSKPVVSWPQENSAMRVIEDICTERNCSLTVSDFSKLKAYPITKGTLTRQFEYKAQLYSTSMIADFQILDAAVAIDASTIAAKTGLKEITQDSITKGIQEAKWPGRFEVIGHEPLFITDGAHNPQGAQSLKRSLESLGIKDASSVTCICGMLADKDYKGTLEEMLPLAKNLLTYTPKNPRAIDGHELATVASDICKRNGWQTSVTAFDNAYDAVNASLKKESPEGAIVSFGTLYEIAAVKEAYSKLKPLSGQ